MPLTHENSHRSRLTFSMTVKDSWNKAIFRLSEKALRPTSASDMVISWSMASVKSMLIFIISLVSCNYWFVCRSSSTELLWSAHFSQPILSGNKSNLQNTFNQFNVSFMYSPNILFPLTKEHLKWLLFLFLIQDLYFSTSYVEIKYYRLLFTNRV